MKLTTFLLILIFVASAFVIILYVEPTTPMAKLNTTTNDTVPPELHGIKDIVSAVGAPIDYFNGVSASDDMAPELIITIDTGKVQVDRPGIYEAVYSVSDTQNVTTAAITVTILEDHTPPVIEGANVLYVQKDCAFDFYLGFVATDDLDPAPELKIDTSRINLSEAGVYDVIYQAYDQSGNTATKKVPVHVGTWPKNDENIDSRKTAYLTFDDGPSTETTRDLLAILAKYDVKATFFVVGGTNEHILKEIDQHGHALGLHTYSHEYSIIYESEDAFFEDMYRLEQYLLGIVGYAPQIMRFPAGSNNYVSGDYNQGLMTRLTKEVYQRGYRYYDWNCATWDVGAASVEEIVHNLKSSLRLDEEALYIGAHDTVHHTIAAMDSIIPYLLEKGYHFKIIDEKTPEYHFYEINN